MVDEIQKDAPEFIDSLPVDHQIVEEQIDRYGRAANSHELWAKDATIATNFLEGDQWTAAERAVLEGEGRPIVTKNKLAVLFRTLMGYQQQNRYELKYLPATDGTGAQNVAEAIGATVKQIDEKNQLSWLKATVFQDGITTGRGFFDARLDFSQNGLGEAAITVEDPFSILIDPEADSYNPNDFTSGWTYFTKTLWMSPIDIFLLYGGKQYDEVMSYSSSGLPASTVDPLYDSHNRTAPDRYFGLDHFISDRYSNYVGLYSSPFQHINRYRKLVRVIDSQHRKLKRVRYFYDLETGGQKVIPDSMSREQISRIVEWVRARNIPLDIREGYKKMVRWTITAGHRVLWDKWSPYCEEMTLVPYFPYFRRGKTRGMFDDLIDPQREINKRASAFLHMVMTTANSGWTWEEGALDEEQETALEEWGSRPGIHIKYREGYEPPKKIEPSVAPTAPQRLIQMAEDDLKTISGINDSALGNLDRVQSGRAIQARQQQTILGAGMYFDNFSRSHELLGIRLKSIIQGFYNEPRIVRSRAGDGSKEELIINAKGAAGDIVNNVTAGNYQVAVDEAPVSATFQQGQFQELLELIQMGMPVPWDFVIDRSSMPNKEEIKQYIAQQRALQTDAQLLQNITARIQIGAQPAQPLPPITTPFPAVTEMNTATPQQPMAAGVPGQMTAAPLPPGQGTPPAMPGGAPAGQQPELVGPNMTQPLPQLRRPPAASPESSLLAPPM